MLVLENVDVDGDSDDVGHVLHPFTLKSHTYNCTVNYDLLKRLSTVLFSFDQTPDFPFEKLVIPLLRAATVDDDAMVVFYGGGNYSDDFQWKRTKICHAILIYLACTYNVPDHWYPADLRKRAKLHSVLDWHHTNLRQGSVGYLITTILAPIFGKQPNPERAAESEQALTSSFSTIETVWLKGDAKFLLGNDKPSIAGLSLVSEIMQLHMFGDAEMNRLISPFKKVQQWIKNVKNATNPHFDGVLQHLFDAIASSKQNA